MVVKTIHQILILALRCLVEQEVMLKQQLLYLHLDQLLVLTLQTKELVIQNLIY